MWDGHLYQKGSLAQFQLANDLLKDFPFKGNEQIMDLGCGDGKITSLIAQEKVQKGHVTGIDLSPSMIATAADSYAQIPNVSFVEADVQSFQFNRLFDLIVSFSALHWAPDQEAVWKRIHQHLKIGGNAFISLNPLPRQRELADTMDEMIKNVRFRTYLQHFKESPLMPQLSIHEYRELVLKSGLWVKKATQLWDHFEFLNGQVFIDHLLGWLPLLGVIPANLKRPFIEEFAQKFLEKTNQNPNDRIKLYFNRFIVEAERRI